MTASRRAFSPAGALLLSIILVLLPPGDAAGQCNPDVSALQVLGDFNGWDPYAPAMSQVSTCTWADTLAIFAGCYLMKFRTDYSWDFPPDLGRCTGVEGPCQLPVPADGTPLTEPVCPVIGTGTALGELDLPVTGLYEFVVEIGGPGTSRDCHVRFLEATAGPGSISGTVQLSDDPPHAVLIIVSVFEAGTTNLVTFAIADPIVRTFQILGVLPGSYDLLVEAEGYTPEWLYGVDVLPGENTDVGTVLLEWLCIPFWQLQVVGDFNGWDENAPPMTQTDNCAWADTLVMSPGCTFVKFRTNADWDPTPDYGRCTGSEGICQTPVPADGTALSDSTCLVTGMGTAIGQLEFFEAGRYEFLVDGGAATYSVRFLDAVVSVEAESWGRVKASYRE